jgi:hypothetical protein
MGRRILQRLHRGRTATERHVGKFFIRKRLQYVSRRVLCDVLAGSWSCEPQSEIWAGGR